MGIPAAALLWAVALPLTPTDLSPSLQAALSVPRPPASQGKPSGLSEKESFMLLFGKGNGAMRMLCVMQRDGLIDAATRRRYADRLEQLLTESGDKEADRRNLRIGMAFADARPSLCPERLLKR